MYAIATFVIVAIPTMIFTRLVTGALIATGLPPDMASFQARSAFTGVGFTTIEAENVVNHPLRRRIIAAAMIVGTLGTATLVVAVLLGFLAPGPGSITDRLLAAVAGMLLFLVLLSSRSVTRRLVEVGRWYAHRHLVPALGGRAEELVYLGDGSSWPEWRWRSIRR